MVRGTVVALTSIRLLPTFSNACVYSPAFLRLYARHLRSFGFCIPVEDTEGSYQRFTGDTSVPGKGGILVWQPRGS
jgi:formylmethanofuran dehydrogenase subunit C